MKIKSFASSSKGNCYLISDSSTSLLIECGIRFEKIKQHLNYNLKDIKGCLISHCHKDHSKSFNELLSSGVKVFSSEGTKKALECNSVNFKTIKSKKSFEIGSFVILPFETQHDCPEPVGFLIYSKIAKERLLFATDTYYIKYKFDNLDYIMIECNYDLDILNKNVESGKLLKVVRDRVLKSHFSVENVIKYLENINLKKCKKIYLLHLSDGNSNEEEFRKKIQYKFYKDVEVCKA